MKLALFGIGISLYLFAVVACNRPVSASAESTQNAAAAQPIAQDHTNQQHAAAVAAESGTQTVAITVGADGFAPNHVEVQRGNKATLRFTRTSDQTCATAVAFPELGLNKPLPLKQAVDIEIPADKARTLTFQCGMGMFKSKVVVL
jgi:membrane fusion protein, copper/silver efflux system